MCGFPIIPGLLPASDTRVINTPSNIYSVMTRFTNLVQMFVDMDREQIAQYISIPLMQNIPVSLQMRIILQGRMREVTRS